MKRKDKRKMDMPEHELADASSMLEHELADACEYLSPSPEERKVKSLVEFKKDGDAKDPEDHSVFMFRNAVHYIRMRLGGGPKGTIWAWDSWVAKVEERELSDVFESPPEPPQPPVAVGDLGRLKETEDHFHHLTHDELYWIVRRSWEAARAPSPRDRMRVTQENMLLVTVSAALQEGLSIAKDRADILAALAAAVVAHTEEDGEETRGIILKIIIRKLKWEKVNRDHDLGEIVQEAKKRRHMVPGNKLPKNQETEINRLRPIQPTVAYGKGVRKGRTVVDKRNKLQEKGILPS